MFSTSRRSALFSHEYHVRLILLGYLLHWRDQLPVGGMSVYILTKSRQFSQLAICKAYKRIMYFFKK